MPAIKEVSARSVLSKSGIPGADYCINPYTGCAHACRYCYATFMGRYSGHTESWGTFVDVKVNAPEILKRETKRVTKGSVIISSVTDPYQPAELKYRVTRKCLEALLPGDFSVDLLTKSPLVLRDIDLFSRFADIEVGITVTTDDDRIRRIFEPQAPPVQARIRALRTLREKGIRTYAFVGPLLPMDPCRLGEQIRDCCEYVYIDRMNYVSKTAGLYRELGLSEWLDDEHTSLAVETLRQVIGGKVSLC